MMQMDFRGGRFKVVDLNAIFCIVFSRYWKQGPLSKKIEEYVKSPQRMQHGEEMSKQSSFKSSIHLADDTGPSSIRNYF
ncbi:hypothetical protein Hdeb2414_s0006g00218241 [Helianthus debilis subsp. tardiflorus]